MSELLTVRQAAQRLNVSEGFLNRLRSERRDGPTYVRLMRSIRYREEDLDAWTARNAVKNGEPSKPAAPASPDASGRDHHAA